MLYSQSVVFICFFGIIGWGTRGGGPFCPEPSSPFFKGKPAPTLRPSSGHPKGFPVSCSPVLAHGGIAQSQGFRGPRVRVAITAKVQQRSLLALQRRRHGGRRWGPPPHVRNMSQTNSRTRCSAVSSAEVEGSRMRFPMRVPLVPRVLVVQRGGCRFPQSPAGHCQTPPSAPPSPSAPPNSAMQIAVAPMPTPQIRGISGCGPRGCRVTDTLLTLTGRSFAPFDTRHNVVLLQRLPGRSSGNPPRCPVLHVTAQTLVCALAFSPSTAGVWDLRLDVLGAVSGPRELVLENTALHPWLAAVRCAGAEVVPGTACRSGELLELYGDDFTGYDVAQKEATEVRLALSRNRSATTLWRVGGKGGGGHCWWEEGGGGRGWREPLRCSIKATPRPSRFVAERHLWSYDGC